MPEDVLEKLSNAIGRKVTPFSPGEEKPSTAQPAMQQSSPTQSSLEKAIGRSVQPQKVSPLAMQRFKIYSDARTNGIAPESAMKTAMATAAIAGEAKPETPWERAKAAVEKTQLGTNLSELGRMYKEAKEKLSNPFGGTDQEWEGLKQKQQAFYEKHLGKGFTAGAVTGATEFGEELLSPPQLMLLAATSGESLLARAAYKSGIPLAVPVAKTLSKLVQAHFISQMIEGTATGIEETTKAAWNGDWESAGKAAVEGLASGLMAKGLISHEEATARVRTDLEKTAREKYGVPEGHPVKAAMTSRFDQLNSFQQGLVIDEAVKRSKEYQDVIETVDDHNAESNRRTKRQQQRRLEGYYSTAVGQAWDENVARRTMRGLQAGRERRAVMEAKESRQKAISDHLQAMRDAYALQRKQAQETRTTRRQETAEQRRGEQSEIGRVASSLADKRNQIWNQRQDHTGASSETEAVPRREIEAVTTGDGQVAYPAMFWGEENHFGVIGDLTGHAVYRQTPRGTEWLDSDGNFSEEPRSFYSADTPDEADTMARLSALNAQAMSLAEEESGEHVKEADELSAIHREYAEGAIDAKEARKRAGIADKSRLPDEFTAARDGRLNGPFHESSAKGYYDSLAEEAKAAGLSDEETQTLLNESGLLARQQTESNLDHLYRPGDYIVSKRGAMWTLDSKGILHSNEGQAVPLMKRGMYSNDAIQLAQSGRVGYGTETREERRSADARRRQTEVDIRKNQEQIDREMRLAVQREGLVPTGEAEPRTDAIEKEVRRQRFMSRPPQAPESPIGGIVRMVFQAPTDAKSVIRAIAARNGVSEQEVMRLQIANDPERINAPESKVARLEVGDTVSDEFRKDRPWKVEQGKDGKLYLRSGNASPLLLDRLNPSERVKKIVGDGKVTQTNLKFSEGEFRAAAFERPHYIDYQSRLTEQVRDRMEGKAADPEPKTPQQVEAQAQAAERRADAAESVATRAVIESQNPPPDITLEKAEGMVDEAQENIKVAQAAKVQEAEAKAKLTPERGFPQRAPIGIGYRSPSGMITQNGKEYSFHYEVVPLDSVVTSHKWNGTVLEPNDEYPSPLQPRTISESQAKNAAANGERPFIDDKGVRRGYNFQNYADRTNSSLLGPAIVDPSGWGISGNRRLLMMRRHLEVLKSIADPEEREAALLGFRSGMRKLAAEVGVDSYPDDGGDNVVVRMLDKPIDTEREAAELGMLFNSSVSEQITQSARGISYAKTIDKPLLEDIGRRTEAYDGLVPAMQADPEFFRGIVIDRFGVSSEEYAHWFDDIPGRGLVLNEQGRRQFGKVMIGTVIEDSALLNRIEGRTPYRAAERAIGHLIRMHALPERDIVGKITEALRAAADTMDTDPSLSASNDRWMATYHPDQQQFAGMETDLPPEPDRVTEVLWRALTASDAAIPRVFNDRLKSFIGEESSLAGQLFEESRETPAEAFNRTFNKELKEVQFSRRDGQEGITQTEYDQALNNRELSDAERLDAENSERKGGRGESPELAEGAAQASSAEKKGGITTPPKPPTKDSIAARAMEIEKSERGYVTPARLREFLDSHPATKDHVSELMRTAKMMAEYVFDTDPPVGVDRKQALDWVLKERLAGIEAGELRGKRGQYSDPLIEKGIGDAVMKLHKAADPTTFIHEFAHVIFPMLSDEDLKAIDTIEGEKGKGLWDGHRASLNRDVYAALSEKLANGLERFLRDENPTGFTHEVKAVLAKIKDIMRKVYMAFAKDPLSEYEPSEDARDVFSKMFGITDFDVQDSWREEVKKARTEENRMKMPEEELHPLQKIASTAGATGIRNEIAGKVEDSVGARVDPRKPVAALTFTDEAAATAYWDTVVSGKGKIDNAELIQAEDGTWGVRFNTKTKVPSSVLYQDVPRKHLGLELEDLKKRLAATPESAPMVRKLLRLKVQNLENEIRARHGVETEAGEKPIEVAAQVRQEVKDAAKRDTVRKEADGESRVPEPQRTPAFSQPPRPPEPKNAGARPVGRVRTAGSAVAGAHVPRSLVDVPAIALQPLTVDRGEPVGTVAGEPYEERKWRSTLAVAGLPENLPPPTWTLDRKTADKLIFPGQKEVVQTALSALEQGDAAVVATATGSGKGYTSMGMAKEWLNRHPEARILYITKNQKLLRTTRGIAENTFGFNMERKVPDRDTPAGVYGTTYMGMIADPKAENTHWDVVIADESGEARNWFKEDNQQGKRLMAVTANAEKAVYFSATPFHSPMEYGYLNKLNLWPKNGFDKWIEDNFAHEKIDGKVVARLDPAKQAKLRQQLIERGQLVSQAISYEGFTAHFGVVPVTDAMKRGLDRIHEGFARAKKQLIDMKKRGLAEKVAAFEATYTKAYLERERLPQAIELANRARSNGWHVGIFSETSSEDLFRRSVEPGDEMSTYQQLDQAMDGQLSRIIPPFPNIYDRLKLEFGDQIGDYSGRGNSMGERDKALTDFLTGDRPILYSTYAAGGIGVSMHDADFPELGIKGGDKPRAFIMLGPPYSGVLLEQAMGRPWRFGVKSDAHMVFLATDAEPDVRLMQEKVGPRMKALRASVLGERDSLASVMASYSDEEKTRARQESLAYQEGNEPEMDARSFQVRSKSRNVGINDWSQINFPPADTAKNRGMRYGTEVPGGDWSNLYQSKFGMQQPDSPEESAGKDTVDSIGNGLSSGVGMPYDVSVQNLDPADRDVVVGAASAVATDAVEVTGERSTKAAARQAMQSQMQLPGDRNKWILTFPNKKGKVGVWRYTGDPSELPRKMTIGEDGETPSLPKDIRTWYGGAVFNQVIGIQTIARRAGASEAGDNIVRMNRSYQADADVNFADFAMDAHDIMQKHKLDTRDPKVMNDLWDTVEGRRVPDNPDIRKAAEEIADLHERIHTAESEAGVKLKTPAGETIKWADITKDRQYMPHRIDWDARVQDPLSGETHKLRDIMKETFAESSRRRIIEAIAKERNYTYDQVVDYLRAYSPNTPVLGHIHRARTIDFPFIKKDWKTLMGYYRQAADAIAVEKNFGSEREKLNKEIARIPSENGRRTIKSMFDGLLEPQEWQDWTAKVYNAAIAFEAATKMTISVLKVPFHLVHIPLGLKGHVMPVVKALSRSVFHPKDVRENAIYVGTLARQLNVADVAGEDTQSLTHQIFGKTGFNAAYRLVRAIAGESARIWMEQYAMRDLLKYKRLGSGERETALGTRTVSFKGEDETRRILRDVMLIGDKAIDQAIVVGRFAPEDLAKGQTAFANLTTWSNNPLQMPGWARLHIEKAESTTTVGLKRAVRLTYALQSFSLKSTSLLREHLYDEVVHHGNLKPLAYAVVAYPIIGQMLGATGAAGKGFIHRGMEGLQGKQHTEDSWDKFIKQLEDTFEHPEAVKFLKWYIDGWTLGVGWDRVRRWTDPFLNAAIGHNKEAQSGLTWLLKDEGEQIIGPAYGDLVETLGLGVDIGKIELGEKHPEQKKEKIEKSLKKEATQIVPILRQVPAFTNPPKPKKKPVTYF